MKKAKPLYQVHTARTRIGSGDYTGTAIKQKVGKVRDIYPIDYSPMSNKKIGTPPKSLA